MVALRGAVTVVVAEALVVIRARSVGRREVHGLTREHIWVAVVAVGAAGAEGGGGVAIAVRIDEGIQAASHRVVA